MYKWIEPKICSETVQGAAQLPASGAKQDCPPCNPGFFVTNSSSCEPCEKGFYSNGTGAGVRQNQTLQICIHMRGMQMNSCVKRAKQKKCMQEQAQVLMYCVYCLVNSNCFTASMCNFPTED